MIKLSDFGNEKGNIWDAIKTVNDFNFFTSENVEMINNLMIDVYGDKNLVKKYYDLDIERLANSIVLLHGGKWKTLIDINALDLPITTVKGGKVVKTVVSKDAITSNKDDINKKQPLNTTDLKDFNSTVSSNNDEKTGESTTTIITDDGVSFDNIYSNLTLAQQHNIITTMLDDVIQFLTLTIY